MVVLEKGFNSFSRSVDALFERKAIQSSTNVGRHFHVDFAHALNFQTRRTLPGQSLLDFVGGERAAILEFQHFVEPGNAQRHRRGEPHARTWIEALRDGDGRSARWNMRSKTCIKS